MLNLNLDIIIFVGSFAAYCVANFFYRTKKTSIDDYNHPKRNFATIKIAATSTSLWIASGLLFYTFIESYNKGFYMIIPTLFIPASFLFIAKFISPRIKGFFGKSSLAQIARELWGDKAALIISISYILFAIAILGTKFKFMAELLEIMLGVHYKLGIIISVILIISYSLFARIKFALFSDVIQFTMFSCILPITLLMAWICFTNTNIVWESLISNPKFNIKHVFYFHDSNFYDMLGLCTIALIPKFGPLVFTNISMSQSPEQSKEAFKISALILFILQLITIVLAIVLFSENPNINPDSLFQYCIDNYLLYKGLKGFMCVCTMILALCLCDFLLLSSSTTLTRDVLYPVGFQNPQNELRVFWILSIIACLIASYIALNTLASFKLLIGASSILMTLVSIPLLFTISGFRSSELSVTAGMIASIITMIMGLLRDGVIFLKQ